MPITSTDTSFALQASQLPGDKVVSEQEVANAFALALDAMRGAPFRMTGLRQNRERDLDFTITTEQGDSEWLLELTEFAPLKGPYTRAPTRHTVGELADQMVEAIAKKASGYPKSGLPKVLLVYCTHFAFRPTASAYAVAQASLSTSEHPFKYVFFLELPGNREGVLRVIAPLSGTMATPAEVAELRERELVNLDPRTAEAVPGGVRIPIRWRK